MQCQRGWKMTHFKHKRLDKKKSENPMVSLRCNYVNSNFFAYINLFIFLITTAAEKLTVIDKILELLQLFKVEPAMFHDRAFVGARAGTTLSLTSSRDLFWCVLQSDDREECFGPVSFRHLNSVLFSKATNSNTCEIWSLATQI